MHKRPPSDYDNATKAVHLKPNLLRDPNIEICVRYCCNLSFYPDQSIAYHTQKEWKTLHGDMETHVENVSIYLMHSEGKKQH